MKTYKDMLREKLTMDYIRTCNKINCSEVTTEERDDKVILSYTMLEDKKEDEKLVEIEYVNGLLNRIYKGGELTFDYNAIE